VKKQEKAFKEIAFVEMRGNLNILIRNRKLEGRIAN